MGDGKPWAGLPIEIRFKLNGAERSALVMTDSKGWFQWSPPAGVGELYFRTCKSQIKNSVVLLQNEPSGMLPLWTPEEFAHWSTLVSPATGWVRGCVVDSLELSQIARAFQLKLLAPDRQTLRTMPEGDDTLKLSDTFIKKLKEAAKKPNAAKPVLKMPSVWK
ncbi:MAG: hypothetical protein ABSG56_26640 [Bryobacteraceae bacterium]|jgi:hypothetical protein